MRLIYDGTLVTIANVAIPIPQEMVESSQYVAIDADGEVWVYGNYPIMNDHSFDSAGFSENIATVVFTEFEKSGKLWKTTVTEIPKC